MKLIVGLGNPGPKYETTRHNAGFLMVDSIAEKASASWSTGKFDGELAKGNFLGESCTFLKPMTFMNLSGRSVSAVMRFFKIELEDVIVLHDDIDVPSGKVKTKANGGHGGNNGIRSIIECLGTREFHRVKLGVGRPEDNGAKEQEVHNWVLGPMTDAELISLQREMLDATVVRIKGIFDKSL